SSNYQSHVIHLRGMLAALDRAGVPAGNVDVLASDGSDPGADLAILEAEPDDKQDAWLLAGTRSAGRLARPIEHVSTEIDGVELRPATRESLAEWFQTRGAALGSGDTLFLFVTDHGSRAKDEQEGTRITLWGHDQSISVRGLDEQLAGLDPGV